MPDTPHGLVALIQSGWTQIMAILAVVWWCRKIDIRNQDHGGRLDRHEARLQSIERGMHDQALNIATIKEALAGIKLTLDRMYAEMREKP